MLGSKVRSGGWRRASMRTLGAALASAALMGCGSSTVYAPTAWVQATLFDQTDPANGDSCMAGNNMAWLTVTGTGTFTDNPAGIANGASYEGSPASVGCTVAPSGSGFSVSAQVQVGVGKFTMNGTMTTSGTQTNIATSFSNADGAYAEADCTFAFTGSANPDIKAGGVWGTITCPNMTNGMMANVCMGVVNVQLTNCTQ